MSAGQAQSARARWPIATALRRVFAKGYGVAELRADLMAGTVVGIVALPLSMALAIAVGAPPQHGLYTAIIAGASVALFGGCKFQVTGPTAAFVVILAPIVSKHGLSGLLVAGFLAGLMLVAMGLARLGSLIEYIPYPVTTGFTTGIATVIATLQLKDVFGLQTGSMPDHYTSKIAVLWGARGSARAAEFVVAAVTLGLLLTIPRVIRKVPAPLLAIGTVAAVTTMTHHYFPSVSVATIGSRFHTAINGVEVAGIPAVVPSPALPWGAGGLTFSLIQDLFPSAFAIAMLGAIESLLSAVIADGLTNTKHDPNAELVGLGIGNLLAPIFGGIAATGALARTATNIRAGAKSPFASVVHAAVVLLAILFLAPFVAYIPMAALAALLLLVAWNMSELNHFIGLIKVAPKSDVFVLVTCFLLTVFFDMVVAVSVGFVLAAILFMRRMAELTESHIQLDGSKDGSMLPLPQGAVLYEINGPLFFGAAAKAMGTLNASRTASFRVLIIHLARVSAIDATGLVALEQAVANLVASKKKVILAGPLPRPHSIFTNASLGTKYRGVQIAGTLQAATVLAEELLSRPESIAAPPPTSHAPAAT